MSVKLAFDFSAEGKVITNKLSDVNMWNYHGAWTDDAQNQPPDYFSSNFPFVKRIQFMTATGGSETRDLFKNPLDRSKLNDYQFDDILLAVGNVLAQGLKPFIITGNVPLKLSNEPAISKAFSVNVRPPEDYEEYYRYIRALAQAFVSQFGLAQVQSFTWGVLTEYENGDWFKAADETPESTKIAYFKLYDYTVAALEEVVGAQNLDVGAHSMTVIEGLWEELEFIEHCACGINYKTGKRGTHIDFLTASFYDYTPSKLSERTLSDCINILRDKAISVGLENLKYGVDEGRILAGDDGKELTYRVIAHSYQGAYDARQFKTMVDSDIDWFASWPFTTEGLWGGVVPVGVHVANLAYKMVGDRQVPLCRSGLSSSGNEVNGLGSYLASEGIARLLLYNFSTDIHSMASEELEIVLTGVEAVEGSTVQVTQWIVDDTHGNFWPTWWEDQAKRGLTDDDYHWSKYSVQIPSPACLKNQADRDYWYSREAQYKELSKLTSQTWKMEIVDGKLTLAPKLDHHGVMFYEIKNIRKS